MTSLARFAADVVGPDAPVAFRTWDGERAGPASAAATVVINSPDALTRILQAPGQLGLGRAYVAGDLDVEGDIFAVLDLPEVVGGIHLDIRQWSRLAGLAGPGLLRPLPPPPGEAHLRGTRHSRERDRAAVAHHYDVSNEFFSIVLGPSMTYSCAVWSDPAGTLEEAQAAKYELVCAKLGLQAGDRLLDVGCGWGGMVCHAARRHGAAAVGITVSRRQQEWGLRAVGKESLDGKVEIRLQDYRETDDGPYDAISSIGMSEHVGRSRLSTYFNQLHRLLRPGGRLLNHCITALPRATPSGWRAAGARVTGGNRHAGFGRRSFMDRYVFPDGELIEVGKVISTMQQAGFEVRHVESLRDHYGLTLRRWVANLEAGWDDAVAAAGLPRARTWRLYMAASARTFETGRTGIHQILAVKPDNGRSGLPLRPHFG
ncbi:MAG TPA: class I SAM-dependent methyltransferase [Acidimicrobiales bacterium]|nr:class I SAM-dependent methyltransferase [Acidimicrobiales bacterium]